MSDSEKQLWMERIARALADLKRVPVAQGSAGEAREAPAQPKQGK
jgi:hypothetical protein